MVVLWCGASLPFLEAACAALDRERIVVAAPAAGVLIRNSANRYHLREGKEFIYVLGVRCGDFPRAKAILKTTAETAFPEVGQLECGGQDPATRSASIKLHRRADFREEEMSADVFLSDDPRRVEFLEACLTGLDIPFRFSVAADGKTQVFVLPEDQPQVKKILDEIARGASSDLGLACGEYGELHDDPVRSYFLGWFLPLTYLLLWILATLVSDSDTFSASAGPLFAFLSISEFVAFWGMIWMVYQAIRYEVRPFPYCVAALLPLTFIWYFFERFAKRRGDARLPIAVRMRMHPPQT